MVGTATPCDVITRLRKGDPHRMEESVERQNLLQGVRLARPAAVDSQGDDVGRVWPVAVWSAASHVAGLWSGLL